MKSKFCPHCGVKVPIEDVKQAKVEEEKQDKVPREKGFLSIVRLVIGIISVGISAYIIATSATIVYYSTLVGMTDLESTVSVGTAVLLLIGGAIAILSRNAKKRIAPIITALVFIGGAVNSYMGYGGVFKSLLILCIICGAFGLFFVFCASMTKSKK